MKPDILKLGSKERRNLEIAAQLLTNFDSRPRVYHVENIYFDIREQQMWTTIVVCDYEKDSNSVSFSWQILDPKEWENIVTANTIEELMETVSLIHSKA